MRMPTLAAQKKYWKYWQRTRTDSQYARERAEVALDWVKALPLVQPRILDLGCGTGWFTAELARFGSATGLDLNDEAMAEARDRWPHIRFIAGDIFQSRLGRKSFDLIVSLQVVAHVEDQDEFMGMVDELLADGGYTVISTNNRFVMDRLGDDDAGSHAAMGHIENWLSIGELRDLVSRYLDVRKVTTVTPVGNAGTLRIVNSAKLNRVAARWVDPTRTRRLKERLGCGYSVVLLAKKKRARRSRH